MVELFFYRLKKKKKRVDTLSFRHFDKSVVVETETRNTSFVVALRFRVSFGNSDYQEK